MSEHVEKRKNFWAIPVDDVDEWHKEASNYKAHTMRDAAEMCMEDETDLDDGDEVDIVVSEHKDGRDHKVFRIRVEIVREYDTDELGASDVTIPPSPDAPPVSEAVVIDTATLPLFAEE